MECTHPYQWRLTMSADYEMSAAVRNGLADELRDIQAEPGLALKVRNEVLRQRRRRAVTCVFVGLALVVAALPFVLGIPASPGRVTATNGSVEPGDTDKASATLEGIRFSLPSGYAFEGARRANCSEYRIPAGLMPPARFPSIEDQSYASLAFTSPNGAGCLRVANSANYTAEPSHGNPPSDPIVPKGAASIMVGPYHAAIYAEPGEVTTAIFVQIPTPGGGFHDLLVASEGLATSDLESILGRALPQSYTAVPVAGFPTTTTAP
jgi:hypothetical protein